MQPNPELLDELYHRQQKAFPGELPFPERFNLKLDERCFKEGHVNWHTNNPTLFILDDEHVNTRMALVFKYNLPKSFRDPRRNKIVGICTVLYDNMQFSCSQPDKDLEYHFHFYPLDEKTKSTIISYDNNIVFHPKKHETTLRGRIQYATKYVNSEGAYFDLWGYLYIPKRKGTNN